jgi:hypothetical protein
MIRRENATVSLVATALAGCVPGVGISGKREGSDIVFSIVSCPLPLHDLPVKYVAVFKEGRRDQEPDCKLVSTNVGATVLRHWKYGSEPEGFRLGPCAPLLPDVGYTIHVNAVGVGERRFTLQEDGAVSLQPRFACF